MKSLAHLSSQASVFGACATAPLVSVFLSIRISSRSIIVTWRLEQLKVASSCQGSKVDSLLAQVNPINRDWSTNRLSDGCSQHSLQGFIPHYQLLSDLTQFQQLSGASPSDVCVCSTALMSGESTPRRCRSCKSAKWTRLFIHFLLFAPC